MRSASAKRNGLTEERIDEGVEEYRTSPNFSEAEKIALEYSELMQFAPEEIDAAFCQRLREHYSEAEIVELGAFVGFNVGYHTFFRTLDFYPMFTPDGRLVSQEESRRIYGDGPGSRRPRNGRCDMRISCIAARRKSITASTKRARGTSPKPRSWSWEA